MRHGLLVAGILAACTFGTTALADDVTGAQRLICAVVEVSFCSPDEECEQGPPWAWNVPDFVEVDLVKKELRTTKASNQNRMTPIRTLVKEDGQIVVGGVEKGKAFTLVITERNGDATITVASNGEGGIAFGTCTPLATAP